MIERFWKIQKEINRAMDDGNDDLVEQLGNEQDEIVKKLNEAEFKELMNKPLPPMYKAYVKKLRG